MSTLAASDRRQLLLLQSLTLAWMVAECSLSLTSALHAHSPSMFAFGLDSLIEFLSAALVLLAPSLPARQVNRAAGVLLYLLALAVAILSLASFTGHLEPETSPLGMAITAAALLVMPLLAHRKRALALRTSNNALAADAVQTATCAWLAFVSLSGLAIHSLFGLSWAVSAAALLAIPIILTEARRALRGQSCGCH